MPMPQQNPNPGLLEVLQMWARGKRPGLRGVQIERAINEATGEAQRRQRQQNPQTVQDILQGVRR